MGVWMTQQWYLRRNGKESGPGTEEQLRAAFKKRAISLDTELRREDKTEWIKLRDAGILSPEDSNPFISDPLPASETAAGAKKPLIYRAMFDEKPVYGEKLRRHFPNFAERFIAIAIDGAILFFASLIGVFLPVIGLLVQLVIGFFYFVYFQHQWGYTIGRKVMRMHLETLDGKKPARSVFLIRYFAGMLSGILFGTGFFMALFDPKMRTLHDHIAGTVVVRD